MDTQLELCAFYLRSDRLTLAEGLGFILRHHLRGKVCERPLRSNAKAWFKTSGSIWIDTFSEPDALKHISARKNGAPQLKLRPVGNQAIKHDIKLVILMLNILRRWKRRGYVLDGFPFANLPLPLEDPFSEIERPKTKPRKRPVSENNFSLWIEHCSERLKWRTYFAIDTGLNPCELKRLRPSDYNATTDCWDLQRGKTGKVGSIPVTDRCRPKILEAIQESREFVLDFTNEQKDIASARRRSGVYFWFGRDLRTNYYNEILRHTNHDYRAAQRAMLHSDPRTGPAHYEVDDGRDLRPAIEEIPKKFL